MIYAAVLAVWIALTGAALLTQSVFAWSVGIAYVAYDTALIAFVATRIATLFRAKPIPLAPVGAQPSIGVLVAAWNEGEALPRTIDALLAQDDPADLVVVADDGSDDTMASVLGTRYAIAPPALGTMSAPSPVAPALRWLRLPHAGKASALNAALAQMTTDLIVTVDADTILDRDAIRAIRAAFAADGTLVVGGGILTPLCVGTRVGRALEFFQTYEYIRNFMSRFAWSRLDALLLISGAFAAFRRAPLMAVGGFDPASFVEDYELIHRLQRQTRDDGLAWRVRILADAHATTSAPGRVGAFLRQRRRWFAGFLQTQYWHRDMTGAPRYGALGLAMLPVKALDTLQPIYGLTALALLPIFLVTGRAALVVPAFGIMTAKIGIDLVFYLVSIAAYRRWTGVRTVSAGASALLAALVEPFTFQPLRHVGATWGWFAVLTGDRKWGSARPPAM